MDKTAVMDSLEDMEVMGDRVVMEVIFILHLTKKIKIYFYYFPLTQEGEEEGEAVEEAGAD